MERSSTKFGWKRKRGDQMVKSQITEQFANHASDDDEDIQMLIPKRACISLEDGILKAQRLKREGITLAEADRYWEAIKKWDEAIDYVSNDETIHEMKAQAFMELHEVVQAVYCAQKAVDIKPNWWVAHQTLGRAYLSLGEVNFARISFQRAIFLDPSQKELWEDDLEWSLSLVARKLEMDKIVQKKVPVLEERATISELDEDQCSSIDDRNEHSESEKEINVFSATEEWKTCPSLNKLPNNYVLMR